MNFNNFHFYLIRICKIVQSINNYFLIPFWIIAFWKHNLESFEVTSYLSTYMTWEINLFKKVK